MSAHSLAFSLPASQPVPFPDLLPAKFPWIQDGLSRRLHAAIPDSVTCTIIPPSCQEVLYSFPIPAGAGLCLIWRRISRICFGVAIPAFYFFLFFSALDFFRLSHCFRHRATCGQTVWTFGCLFLLGERVIPQSPRLPGRGRICETKNPLEDATIRRAVGAVVLLPDVYH